MSKKKSNRKFRPIIKLLLCLFYFIIIAILVLVSFKLFKKDQEIVNWSDVTSTDEYSYIKVNQMSEAFAVTNDNKEIHFVIEQDETLEWHTYLIAISKDDYNNYKSIIDYTYERTTEKPEVITVYGYPKKITNNIKELAIKNIANFVPIENQIVLTNENFEEYLTNTYLDTTIPKTHKTNYIIVLLLTLALILFILIIFTIFDRDRIVDEVEEIIEKENDKLLKKKTKK